MNKTDKMNNTTTINEDKYFKIERWLSKRFTKDGILITENQGKPTKYKRLVKLAWWKYMYKCMEWKETTDGDWLLCAVSRSGLAMPIED